MISDFSNVGIYDITFFFNIRQTGWWLETRYEDLIRGLKCSNYDLRYVIHKCNKTQKRKNSLPKCVPVTTAWRVLRLQMDERPPDMEGSCEYIE
jgi:hypothetical protein